MNRILAAIWVAAALPAAVAAQGAGWPVKPVRVIVPFTAGSPVEIPARPVAQRLAETLGQQFLIDNRTGASGTIGDGARRQGAARRLHAALDQLLALVESRRTTGSCRTTRSPTSPRSPRAT